LGAVPDAPPPYEIGTAGSLPVLRWPALAATGVVDALVTTRWGGVSTGPYEGLNLGLHVGDDAHAVLVNRGLAAAAVGLRLDDLVFCKQSHGRSVAQVGTADRGRGGRSDHEAIADTDALVTTDSDVGLVVMVADCVPIVMVDPEARVLACVHAGWRGTTQRVTEAAVDHMVKLGAEPGRLLVGIGPAIPADRYQVGEDVLAAAREGFGAQADRLVRPDGTGRWQFDLWAANRVVLHEAGVPEGNVHLADVPTGTGDFFSDRAFRPCGRFAAIARLVP
jgi:purine-nucleoside/S-methyl-5'-thioadenosine phosphorylase / adenosine deaminase